MSKKILFMSSAKLTAFSIGLLLAVFCTIGMSFRPVYSEDEKELVMSEPRHAHWVSESSGCTGTSYTYNNKTDYGKAVAKTLGGGSVSVSSGSNNTSAYTNNPSTAANTQSYVTWNTGFSTSNQTGEKNDLAARHSNSITLTAIPADGYMFVGWYADEACATTPLSTMETYQPTVVIPGGVYEKGTIKTENDAKSKYGDWQSSGSPYTETFYAKFQEITPVDLTFVACEGGTYTVTINSSSSTVSTSDVVKTGITTSVSLSATPATGYVFLGWYQINSSDVLSDLSASTTLSKEFAENVRIGARFVSTSTPKFKNITTSTEYYGLRAALSAAVSGQTIIPVAEESVLDGADLLPADNGTYTIPDGVTLLVPYNSSNSVQTKPAKINGTANATAITIYKKLKFTEGVNIVCNGTICVGGQACAGNGGNPSGYVTGACGFIDMSAGGHIELNGTLYCWGFIKGQDMDQGNNTQDVGTITANDGATIWEDFSVGDWRGGTATTGFGGRFFPFQSYFIQNIEIPVTYKYGSKLKNFFTFNMSSSAQETSMTVVGSDNGSLFKLTDSNSLVRKWYDPTTDLMCYELSGTAILDYISLTISGVPINSADYDLPINSNMHVILTKCTMTLNRPMLVQPGAIFEIKDDANVTIATNIYLYDKDQWGPWISSKYYRSYGGDYPILTSHKNRGDGSSNKDLDDAAIIVDGTLTISGGLYSSTGGANVMGNGGGKVVFSAAPPTSAGSVKWYKGTKTSGDGEVGTTAMTAANLCNENGFYTKSAKNTFHNVHGRWFVNGKQNEKADHTFDFTYMAGENIGEETENRNTGADVNTDAVYSNDKTGMEARMKWANVTADACADWWHGQGDQAGWFYNWTMNNAWHQFQTTETEGLYSGSNNTLYTKSDCTWEELGSTDINCLYTIDGKKKALVAGHFIELEPNSDDAAFHEVADATKYYICFEGCNWHEATKIEGEKKAYAINEDNFIWYEDRWMQAEREIPFFYTYDETNVKVYYEYIGSEWVLAQPYVEVKDALETRQLLTFSEALTVASAKKNATIKILRDIPNVITSGVYTGVGQTCTLDLNGHIVTSSCQNLLTVNAKSGTLTILDNTTDKKGELRACPFANARTTGFTVTAGTLVLQSGKMYSTNSATRTGSTAATYKDATNTGIVVAGTFNVTGGILESEDEYQNYGAQVSGTVNLSAGKIIAKTTKWYSTRGVYLAYGKLNISGTGALEVTAAGSDAVYGVYVHATASYNASKNTTSKSAGTLTMTGGSINAQSGKNAYAVYVNRAVAVASTTDRTIKADALGVMTMSGGTIEAIATSSTNARGVSSYGTVTISGGSITATAKANTTAYGISTFHGVTTIKGTANIMANATGTAYGVLASGDINGTYGYLHKSDVKIENGTITANATTGNTAYAVYVTGTTKTVANAESAAQKVFNGDYAAAGSATITTGTFEANAKGTTAAGIFVNSEAAVTKGEASDIPTCTVNGGKFKMTGSSAVTGCNNAADPADFHINGGYYSHNGNLATYAASPKHVLTLASGDANRPPYYYKVAEAYLVTFKNEDGTANIIDPVYQEVGTAPVCSTEPTKESTSTNSFTFDGWATEANGAKVYEPNGLPNVTSAGATYYAHFATTTLKYRVHFDAATNGGECATENIYVEPGKAVSTAMASLPTATKYGYAFNGWYTESTGGTKLETTTVINADAEYFAQFIANSHTLTWNLAGGKVSTAGKIGSTTWPAANATGTPSTSVTYGTVLTTIPVVAKTGYVFNRWDPVPTSSMPDNDVTYTALWNPATNTKYYVKHYQQNIDDNNYTLEETDNLTGTTGATVTPDRKSYDGFLTPGPQQLTIGAAGTTELAYYYDRVVYTINWNASANGGACATTSTDVRHGATIALPAATKAGHILEGWYTKAEGGNKISDGAAVLQNYGTLYAQFIEVPTYELTWDWNGGETSSTSYTAAGNLLAGDPIVYPEDNTMTRENYVFNGWSTNASTMPNENFTITAQWVSAVASVTAGGTTYYKTLSDAFTAAKGKTNPTIKLLQETALGASSVTYDGANTCILNLNGQTISGTGTRLLTIDNSSANFTITDLTEGKLGKLSLSTSSTAGAAFCAYAKNGKLYLEAGTIYLNSTSTGSNAVGVRVDAGGTFTMNEGTVHVKVTQNNRVGYSTQSLGTTTINGGTVRAESANGEAYGAYVTGTMTINGGKFYITGKTVSLGHESASSPTKLLVQGGYYNTNSGMSSLVAPGKSGWKYYLLNTTAAEKTAVGSDYLYKVAEAYTVTFMNGSVSLQSGPVEKGVKPAYAGTPTKDADVQYSYTFDGWTVNPDGSGTVYTASTLPVVGTAAATYYAHYSKTEQKYSVNVTSGGHGSVSPESVSNIGCETASGDITATPDAGYSFSGWTLPTGVTAATGYNASSNPIRINATATGKSITANFTANTGTAYTVEHYWQNIDNDNYTKHETEGKTGTTDAATAAVAKSYTGFNAKPFAQGTIAGDGNTVVKIYYDRITYAITWKDGNGNTIKTDEHVKYGATPVYSGATPTKNQTVEHTYTFNNTWSPAIASVTGAATYTALFNEAWRKYDITWKGEGITTKTKQVEYNTTPEYGEELPTKEPTESEVFTYKWMNAATAHVGVQPVTGDATYVGSFVPSARPYMITFVNDDNTELQSSEVGYGSTPTYTGANPPTSVLTPDYEFDGWKPEIAKVNGPATYTAVYKHIVDPIVVIKEDTVKIDGVNTGTTSTTVHVSGVLDVAEDHKLTTDDLILEGSANASGENASGEITGQGAITAENVYFYLYREGGFKERTWYAVAVPWKVWVPAGGKSGVSIKNDKGNFEQQELGIDFDLIYYDGARRANGDVKTWNYLEKDPISDEEFRFMEPGVAYMIYLAEPTDVIRFKKTSRKNNDQLHTDKLEVKEYPSSDTKYANWNGIANPATYHAYLNYGVPEGIGQVYNPDTKGYEKFEMNLKKLAVGQPIFIQAKDNRYVDADSVSYNKPTTSSPVRRRAKEQFSLTRYELYLAPSQDIATDEVIIRMSEEKEENGYVIGQDLLKMGVSNIVPQMWIDRYESKMFINTVAPDEDNTADYPLGIFVPQNGEYDLFLDDELDSESNLYLTYDGEAIWNLSYGPYVASLEKGTNTHYGLRIVKKAPQATTGIEETTIQNGEVVRKVLVNDKVYIIRNGEKYSVTGQKAK